MTNQDQKASKRLNAWYCAGQAFYFGMFCAAIGYASVYLLHKGFTNSQIGIILALGNLFAMILQPIFASWSDDHPEVPLHRSVACMGAITAALIFAISAIPMARVLLAIIFVLAMTLIMTVMPLMNSLAFVYEPQGIKVDFGIGRGFGSGFYALSSLVIGNLSDSISPEIIPIFAAVSTVLLTIAVIFYRLPDTDHGKPRQRMARKTDNGQMSFVEFTKHYKVFMIFLIGIMLVYLDHMFINNFFYQIITPIGGTSVEMGYAISLAAVLEVPIMFLFHKIAKKCKCTTILKFSMIMYVIKHALTWFAMNMTMIYIAQALQMLAYALMCPALVYYVNEIIDQKDLVKGQSMSNVSMTAAGIIADVLGGVMIDSVGVHTALFITLVLTIIGAAIIFATADKTKVIQR